MESPENLLRKAEELCHPNLFKRLLGGGANYDEASSIYMKVANGYKLRKDWERAEAAFLRSAEVSELADDRVQAANMYVEAGNCQMKYSKQVGQMPPAFEKACEIYTCGGRFGQAGRIMKSLAEELEKQGAPEEAMPFWKRAADFYEHDEFSKTLRQKVQENYVNALALYREDYANCVTQYEQMAHDLLDNNLLQYQAKELLFKAFLVSLLQTRDAITASIQLSEFANKDPSRFGQSREFKLCKAICEALEHDQIEDYTRAVTDYANITPLDNWKTIILSRIKSQLFTQTVARELGNELEAGAVVQETLVGGMDLT